MSPQPYSANLNNAHVDNVNEVIHASDVDALATHVNTLETDANAGGPLDLPGHKGSADHDARYVRLPLPVKVIIGGPASATGVAAGNYLAFRLPSNWGTGTVTKIQAYGVSTGTGSFNWNIGKNGTTTVLHSGNILNGSTNTWVASTTLQNNALVTDDALWLIVASVTGTLTQIAIQIEMQVP